MAAKKPKVKPFTPARVKKLARNPGDRSKIPTRLLPQQYRAEREKNARLNAPVAPGSSLTNRQLGRDTKSYITQKYAQGDQAERQGIATQEGLNRDTTGWYDQYLNDLRTHARNIGTFADQNVAQTQGAGTGIANAGTQALAGQTDPISRGINAQAADTRARYAGSFAGQASAVGTADKNYASTVANVVGPGQKLQAQVQGGRTLQTMREKATARADAKGADAQQYRSGRISEEQKIAAADAIAQGKSAVEAAKIAGRTTVAKINAGSKTPPVPYYTWAQWKSMTPAQKRAAVKDYQKKPGGKGGTGTDPKVKPMPAANAGQIKSFKNAVEGARQFKKQNPAYGSDAAARWLRRKVASDSPYLQRAAAEAAVDGFIHKKTAEAIRKQLGIRVRDLGFPVK